MTSSNCSSFFSASMDAEALKSFESELSHTYPDLILASVIALLKERPTYLPPSQGQYPDAVGIDKARDDVTKLLNMTDLSPIAVVVYGVGGIGKTTLATAVFNRLNLTGYKHCRLNMKQECTDDDLKLLQEQILRDLFSRSNVHKLRDCVEGQDELSNSFLQEITQPVFMFIDNALRGTDLVKLLPRDLSCLPPKSRLLITTRKLDETDMPLHLHIQRESHSVECLSSSKAKELLCKKALGNAQISFGNNVDVDGLVKICSGIPLVLEMVGCRLHKDGSNVAYWHNYLKETLAEGEGNFSEKVVDCVFNTLQDSSTKEAFLDIASFFSGSIWNRRWLAHIVGEVQLKALKDAALVKISDEGKLKMHDVVEARGKWLSKSDRITDQQGLNDVLQDKQRLNQIKGIFFNIMDGSEIMFVGDAASTMVAAEDSAAMFELLLGLTVGLKGWAETLVALLAAAASARGPEGQAVAVAALEKMAPSEEEESFKLEGDDLDLMNKSLRILELPKSLKVKGKCNKTIENLRFIVSNQNVPFDLKNLKRLSVFISTASGSNICELPRSLRLLGLRSSDLHESIGNLSLLEEIYFFPLSTFISLPSSFGQLKSLHRLAFVSCKELIELPESFGSLAALKTLTLIDLPQLKGFPDSFGQLNSLRHLKLIYCLGVTTLPESFENLSSLEYLDLSGCYRLESLSQSFCELSNLKVLQIRLCKKLPGLPDNVGRLKSLKYFNLVNCEGITRLCDDFGCLKSLVAMRAKGCAQLEGEVMYSLLEVKSLMFLNIRNSPMLIQRWTRIKEPRPLLLYSHAEEKDLQGDIHIKEEDLQRDIHVEEEELERDIHEDEEDLQGDIHTEEEDLQSHIHTEKEEEEEDIQKENLQLHIHTEEDDPRGDMNLNFDGRERYLQMMYSAMLSGSGERRCVADGGGKLVEWSPSTSFPATQLKVALFFTMLDLLSPLNAAALQMVREKIMEVALQDFQVIYVPGLVVESEEEVRKILLGFPEGVLAWIPPHRKSTQLFAYCAYAMAQLREDEFHSFIASTIISMNREGKPEMPIPNPHLWLVRAGNSFGASFEKLFSAFERVDEVVMQGKHRSKTDTALVNIFDDLEG